MENKHTPGPWVAEPEEASEGRGIAICAPANGWIVATITPEDDRPADEIDWANARLIAEAPAMYRALKIVVEYFEDSYAIYEDMRPAFEVLARIEGREAPTWKEDEEED